MSLGFGLENIDDMFQGGGGMAPTFTREEIAELKRNAEAAKVRDIPRSSKAVTDGMYDVKAWAFVQAYIRKETPWEIMNGRQRKWLWKIKDDISDVVRRDREKRDG